MCGLPETRVRLGEDFGLVDAANDLHGEDFLRRAERLGAALVQQQQPVAVLGGQQYVVEDRDRRSSRSGG